MSQCLTSPEPHPTSLAISNNFTFSWGVNSITVHDASEFDIVKADLTVDGQNM